MPESVRNALRVQMSVPLWAIISTIAGGIWFASAALQRLDILLSSYRDTQALVAMIHERQINGLAALATVQTQVSSHEQRLADLEKFRWATEARK